MLLLLLRLLLRLLLLLRLGKIVWRIAMMVMMARLLLLLLLLLRVQAPAGFNGVAACFQSVSRTSHGHADALVVQAAYGEKTAENTEFLWPWSVMVHSPVSVRQILTALSFF